MSRLIDEVARLRAENIALKAERDNWRKQALEEDALLNHLTVQDYVIGQLVISRNGAGITLGDVRVRILNTVGELDGKERILCDCILSNVADAVYEMKGQLEVIRK